MLSLENAETIKKATKHKEIILKDNKGEEKVKDQKEGKDKYSNEDILLLKQVRSTEEILSNKRVLTEEKKRKEDEIIYISKALLENLEKRDEIATAIESLEEVNAKLSLFEDKYDIISLSISLHLHGFGCAASFGYRDLRISLSFLNLIFRL